MVIIALLGIEITIIALASAASAATHPEGSPVQGSLYEAGQNGWEDGPAYWERAAMAAALSDAYEVGPKVAGAWAFEGLREARERLLAMRDWPMTDERWPAYEGRPHVIHERPAAEEHHAVFKAEPRTEAAKPLRSPVRAGVAKMPRARPHIAHRRAHVDLTRAMPRQAVHMSHRTANGWLKTGGVRTKSTGNCASKNMHHCTSLDSVRTGTIAKVIELKRESRCPIMVTGGTERGHAPGQFSHGNGYKLDISHNACIDRHIEKNHHKAGIRSDGSPLYKSAGGTTFADESDHWDILFR
ncbi:hypothetical protein [Nonomuraea solani]|uniref:hypothetical protein n=1 Tax=Nonomuraea solani TaxID=1144553 RepID=UPI000CDE60D4|nr:hypothetical protein [Nonomuraea solani]